jgi:hypothetical protein
LCTILGQDQLSYDEIVLDVPPPTKANSFNSSLSQQQQQQQQQQQNEDSIRQSGLSRPQPSLSRLQRDNSTREADPSGRIFR